MSEASIDPMELRLDTDHLRAYAELFGVRALVMVAAVICEEQSKAAYGKPAGVMASINAGYLRDALSKFISIERVV